LPSKVPSNERWSCHYQQFLFASGTHYVLLESEDQQFPFEPLAPCGRIFAHGDSAAYIRMKEWLSRGKPAVLMLNTGGVTQAFASLLNALVKKRVRLTENLLRSIQLVSAEDMWSRQFGLPEVEFLSELFNRAPTRFRKTVVVVDIISDSSEEAVQAMTSCFASAESAGGRDPDEVGMGTAECDVVLAAWQQHLTLDFNAERLRTQSNRAYFLLMLLMVVTAFLSVFTLFYEYKVDRPAEGVLKSFKMALIMLPILMSLVGTVMSRLAPKRKWSALCMAAAQVVCEIYKFRLRVLEYDDASNAGSYGGAGAAEAKHAAAQRVRKLFEARIQDVFTGAMDSDLSQTSALRFQRLDQKTLRRHVESRVFHTAKRCCCGWGWGSMQSSRGFRSEDGVHQQKEEVEPDDFVSSIMLDTYFEHRVQALFRIYQNRAPWISLWLQWMEVSALIVVAGGAVVAVLELYEWVAFTVALACVLANISETYGLQSRLSSANAVVKQLQNLETWWKSLGIMDRRCRSTKSRAVQICEMAVLNDVGAWTGTAARILEGPEHTKVSEGNGGGAGGPGEARERRHDDRQFSKQASQAATPRSARDFRNY